MRIFMFCLLAVGALAGEGARNGAPNGRWAYPTLTNPDEVAKCSDLTAVDDFDVNIGDEFGQEKLVRYTQPGYRRVSVSGLVSAYTSDLTARRTGSSPPEYQRQLLEGATGDGKPGQSFLRQLGQRLDQPANLREQQVAPGVQGYPASSSAEGEVIEARLGGGSITLPVVSSRRGPFTPAVQAPRTPGKVDPPVENPRPNPELARTTANHQPNIDRGVQRLLQVERPAGLPVAIVVREPIDYPSIYEESFGPDQTVVIDESQLQAFQEQAVAFGATIQSGSFEARNDPGSSTGHQRVDVADRRFDFGVLQQAHSGLGDVVDHGRPEEELAVAISRVSDTQHSGYRYNPPARTFTF